MQEDVIKHAKKMYELSKSGKHTFVEKLREVAIEIFIIAFAVSLSIGLHSWSEDHHQQDEAREFLVDLREDLRKDIKSMEVARETLSRSANSFSFLSRLTKGGLDSLYKTKAPLNFYSSLGTTKINSGNYEGFKSSGKIGFLENKKLKKLILEYYHDSTPSVMEVEKINYSLLMKILDYWSDHSDQDISERILSPKLKTLLRTFHETSSSSLILYQDAIDLAEKINREIDMDRHQ